MLPYKLIYFNMRGRAELSRYILAYAQIPFKDQRVEWKDWPFVKSWLAGKDRLEEAQADALVDSLNDFTLCIPWREEDQKLKKEKIDKLFDCHAPKLLSFLEKHLEDRDWLVGDAVSRLRLRDGVERLKENKGSAMGVTKGSFLLTPFVLSDPVTWADLYWHVCFTTFTVLRPGFARHHQGLCALINRVESIPQLARWIQNRPVSEF
ncbi:hypothetical protein JZ751_001704 [Albula glossodonta]|uniref:glutathione transferase n=1 Tax=Albula glossodonta TaxID=121402 RepID=A0A8T2PUJ5_9TELE|nr:hypothetical protein JZ751_001704 [Albula glossodonta]